MTGVFGRERRHAVLWFSTLQNVSLSGIIYGWSAISDSVLSDPAGPHFSESHVNLLFSVSIATAYASPIPLGLFMDHFGPRACNVSCCLIMALGMALFALSDDGAMPLALAGLGLVGFGAQGVQNSIVHVSEQFPEAKNTAISVLTGSFNAGTVVFSLFRVLWEAGLSFRALFLLWSGVTLLLALGGFLGLEPNRGQRSVDSRTSSAAAGYSALALNAAPAREAHGWSLMRALRCPSYWRVVAVLLVQTFWTQIVYVGNLDTMIGDRRMGDTAVYSNALNVLGLLSVALVPPMGVAMDRRGQTPLWVLVTVSGAAFGWLALARGPAVLIFAALVCNMISRTALYLVFFSWLDEGMGHKNFGALAGIAFFLTGIVGVAQDWIADACSGTCHSSSSDCSEGSWGTLLWVQCATMTLMVAVPKYVDPMVQKKPVDGLGSRDGRDGQGSSVA